MNSPEGYVIFYIPKNTSTRCYLSRVNCLDAPKFSFGLNKAEIFYVDVAVHDMKRAVDRKLREEGRDDIADSLEIGEITVSKSTLS